MNDKLKLADMFNSRKFRMGVMSIAVVWAMGSMVLIDPTMIKALELMIHGTVYIYGLYCGMNVVNKFVKGKNAEKGAEVDGD